MRKIKKLIAQSILFAIEELNNDIKSSVDTNENEQTAKTIFILIAAIKNLR